MNYHNTESQRTRQDESEAGSHLMFCRHFEMNYLKGNSISAARLCRTEVERNFTHLRSSKRRNYRYGKLKSSRCNSAKRN